MPRKILNSSYTVPHVNIMAKIVVKSSSDLYFLSRTLKVADYIVSYSISRDSFGGGREGELLLVFGKG